MISVIHKSSLLHHNKYGHENATNKGKNKQIIRKVREEKVEAIKTIFFSEIFNYDQLNNFSKPMETVDFKVI